MKWKGRSFTPSAGRWNSSQALEQAAFLCVWMTLAGVTSGCANFRSSVPNASYVGPYVGYENNLTVRQLQSDLRAAYRFKAVKYPGGFVTIFGGSRIPESTALYQQVREFARSWTTQYGTKLPILTGAGPGIMEAGSRGAMEAGGPSIGYTTYYGPATDHGDPKLAFRRYVSIETKQTNDIITDGLIFQCGRNHDDPSLRGHDHRPGRDGHGMGNFPNSGDDQKSSIGQSAYLSGWRQRSALGEFFPTIGGYGSARNCDLEGSPGPGACHECSRAAETIGDLTSLEGLKPDASQRRSRRIWDKAAHRWHSWDWPVTSPGSEMILPTLWGRRAVGKTKEHPSVRPSPVQACQRENDRVSRDGVACLGPCRPGVRIGTRREYSSAIVAVGLNGIARRSGLTAMSSEGSIDPFP